MSAKTPTRSGGGNWPIHAGGFLACATLAGLLYIAGIGPALRDRENLLAQQTDLREQQALASQLSATIGATRAELVKVNQAIADYPMKLRQASQINQQLARLNDLARAGGLKVDEMQPSSVSSSNAYYQTVPIKLAGYGDYRTFVAFLRKLHEQMPDTGVSAMELTGQPSAQGTPIKFVLDLDWYTLPELAAASNPK